MLPQAYVALPIPVSSIHGLFVLLLHSEYIYSLGVPQTEPCFVARLYPLPYLQPHLRSKATLFVVTNLPQPKVTPSLQPFCRLCFTDRALPPSAVVLKLPESLAITGGYAQQYRAVQLHLHWGSPSNPGSEHTVDHKRFAGEVRSVLSWCWAGGTGP